MKIALVRWGLVALMIGLVAGCSSGGSSSDNSAPAAGGDTTVVPPVAAPSGLAPVTITATTPAATFCRAGAGRRGRRCDHQQPAMRQFLHGRRER